MGIVANIRKTEIGAIVSRVLDLLPGGIDVVGTADTASVAARGAVRAVESFNDCDIVLALGGDGTLLMAARFVEHDEIPLLGIKIRSLGFLTEDDVDHTIRDLLDGRFVIQERTRLQVTLESQGTATAKYTALNDAVIHGIGVSRVIHLRTVIDGALLGEYLSDGVIVATPTGSTAYSLAAGGPIVNPTRVCVFVITPLCPHSLSVRPIVVSCDETFTVELVEHDHEAMLTIDGQQSSSIKDGERIVFCKSPTVTRLVVTEGYNFYDIVRQKLKWGGVLRRH
ncbi:MAG TPA: NAD(+)/NADH kinase [Patescibacteria group bacterium]|nr:NAD(+)/NADH kinase [Patescibacteria group bacterium]